MADSKGPISSAPSSRRHQYYQRDLPEIRPEAREVLENYGRIPHEQIEAHLHNIRDKAWAVHSYPCIGQWRFLDLSVGRHRLYPEILDRMRTGEQIYLDLGCAFAQDIRQLVADGVDSANCYGSDYELDFIELGYELFRDKATLKSEFIAADIFDPDSALKNLDGRVDIIGASSFFHLFNWEDQKRIATRVAGLLKPRKGSLVVGRQVGDDVAGEKARRSGNGSRYRHNADSWRRLWQEVGSETGATFEVDVVTRATDEIFQPVGSLGMEFSVRRQ